MASIDHRQAQEFLHMRQSERSEADQQALQAHLAGCAECREYASSLEMLRLKLKEAFHTRLDNLQPQKSQTGGVLIRLGREITRLRIFTYAGSVVGVIALIAFVLGLNYVITNLRPQPATVPILPTGTPTSQPASLPSTAVMTPSVTSLPSPTPLPEGSIVLNWGHAAIPMDSEGKSRGDTWAQGLSKASGLNVVPIPGPSTDLEVLQSLRDGKIQMAELDALAFAYGQEQGWIVAGPVLKYTYQPDGRLMFVARTDSGLIAGDSEQMYQQLEGKRPCWPGKDFYNAPIYEYIAPAGLLVQEGIKLGQPVFVTHPKGGGYIEAEAVFLKECDFAVFESYPVEGFMTLWFDDFESMGVTSNDWKNDMQVLYYTPPLFHIISWLFQASWNLQSVICSPKHS